MKVLGYIMTVLAFANANANDVCLNMTRISNQCIQFTVSTGTGCAWMCNYCANQLGTNNYYFTDGVCMYQQGQGCIGNPIADKQYTCCAATTQIYI